MSLQNIQIHYDKKLPIFGRRDEIITSLRDHQTIVVAGETGSGKTTHLPLMCLDAGFADKGRIGCTQPRRIAATSVARHVSHLLGSPLGTIAGYKIRFDEKCSPHSRIKFMTDGILLAELNADPLLRQYDVIIVDEAHERSINIDFLLGYLRSILPRRPDLKVIISSATIDTETFSRAFGNAPVIEVSGRLYPVEIINEPLDEKSDESYVEAAVRVTRNICDLDEPGDVLVFMPTERDIRETATMLDSLTRENGSAILPLFGRLSSSDQNRIFHPSDRRKIIIATNIAETSITVPGIRFVVDTGFARMVRYLPHLRTSSLPVEPVSKASARQRSGRCGRVQEGICFRLYSTKEFDERPDYTEPEIQRTNLAGVILTMRHLHLGDIESFPFVQTPPHKAVSDGYNQLVELGALDKERALTPLGRAMAQLPLDPHISRMILQARNEQAVREVKIIASALSIVDPRERPLEKQGQADEAHKRFTDPKSDFLAYLKLWDTYMQEWEQLGSQSRIRRFCRDHFLSFNRMREWHDVHEQLDDLCNEKTGFANNRKGADYDAIHQCLLSGLLSNISMKTEKGSFRGTRGRELHIFPGSSLHKKSPPWIMCHQIVETSRVFCRTCAEIDPVWVEALAPHLCKRTYSDPCFDETSGSVRAKEQVIFQGLPLVKGRPVFYGRINPEEASHIFIRDGLAGGMLHSHLSFLKHNMAMAKQVETIEAKLRTRRLNAGEEAISAFYHESLAGISSIHDLNRLIKEKGSDQFLRMKVDDLLTEPAGDRIAQYPDSLLIAGARFPLAYRFTPGMEDDGITLIVPREVLPILGDYSLEWALPVLREQQVACIISNLPKNFRNHFVPFSEHVKRIADLLVPGQKSLADSIREILQVEYAIDVDPSLVSLSRSDDYVRLRVAVTFDDGQTICTSRVPDMPVIDGPVPEGKKPPAWHALERHWCSSGNTRWSFGDLPEAIRIDRSESDIPLSAFPAVNQRDDAVDVVLLGSKRQAQSVHQSGVRRLLELNLGADFAWLEKELRPDRETMARLAAVMTEKQMRSVLAGCVLNEFLTEDFQSIKSQQAFERLAARVKQQVGKAASQVLESLASSMKIYADCLSAIDRLAKSHPGQMYAAIKQDLLTEGKRYIANMSLPGFRYSVLAEYPRYFAAFRKRIDRAFEAPSRYRTDMDLVSAYRKKLDKLKGGAAPKDLQKIRSLDEAMMMIEEFAVSLFAQQAVKAKIPISEKRLDQKFEELSAGKWQ